MIEGTIFHYPLAILPSAGLLHESTYFYSKVECKRSCINYVCINYAGSTELDVDWPNRAADIRNS